jgi:hypothetical protein
MTGLASLRVNVRRVDRQSVLVSRQGAQCPDPGHDTLFTSETRGKLSRQGGLDLHVDIVLERDTHDRARGGFQRYHAQFDQLQFAGLPLWQVFRYDNDHTDEREGHPDAFHKHVFSNRTWRETEVLHIGRDTFPTPAEVIDELSAWWLEHRDDTLIHF